ncbi:unnamed protein product, partial [Rangifer tarandus platyrhynchus]
MTLTTSACERPSRRPPRPPPARGTRRSPVPAQQTPARRSARARTRYLTSAVSRDTFRTVEELASFPHSSSSFPAPTHPPAPKLEPQSGAGRGKGGGWGCRGVAGGEGASLRLHPI